VRDAVSVLNGFSSAAASRRAIGTGASSRALLSAAASLGFDPQVHGWLRAAWIAAARSHSRGSGAAVAGGRRDSLRVASRSGGFAMISRRRFLGAVTMMTESARSLRPLRLPGRRSLESHRAEAEPLR